MRRLESGRTREAIEEHLLEEAKRDPAFVVGLDFAFSFPRGFLEKRAHKRVETVWQEAERLGEQWLAHCPFPFWGKPGKKKPPLGELLHRQTEQEIAEGLGLRPFSIFQIGGAGAVGVGSIRGMPMLGSLRQAGFSIWPFHEPVLPMVVEIWPRLFIGTTRKSVESDRVEFLEQYCPTVSDEFRERAQRSDDAFDALVAGIGMDRQLNALTALEGIRDGTAELEGRIWRAPE